MNKDISFVTPVDANREHSVGTARRYAFEQLQCGISPEEVRRNLSEGGYDAALIATIVDELHGQQIQRETAGKHMLFGALWCVGGILVTSFSYQMAPSTGGYYVVTYGAIIFGALLYLRGLRLARS